MVAATLKLIPLIGIRCRPWTVRSFKLGNLVITQLSKRRLSDKEERKERLCSETRWSKWQRRTLSLPS